MVIPVDPQKLRVPMCRKRISAAAPYFLIPGIGGHIVPFRPMAKKFAERRHGIGVLHPFFLGHKEPDESFDRLCDITQQAIETGEEERPTILVGYSFGGAIAYEIARRLNEKNKPAGAVLVDTVLPTLRKKSYARIFGYRMRDKFLGPREPAQTITHREDVTRMRQALVRIRKGLVLQPSETPVVLIKSQKISNSESNFRPSKDFGWSQVANVRDVMVSPGTHLTMHEEPNTDAYIDNLERGFEQIEQCLGVTSKAPQLAI